MKKIFALMLLCAAVVFSSCKKDEAVSKPAGFGLQGDWVTASIGGQSLTFAAAPSTEYIYTVMPLTVYGNYTYTLETDKLTLQPNRDGAPVETYDIQWMNDQWTSFTLIATGSTPTDKEGIYTKSVQ